MAEPQSTQNASTESEPQQEPQAPAPEQEHPEVTTREGFAAMMAEKRRAQQQGVEPPPDPEDEPEPEGSPEGEPEPEGEGEQQGQDAGQGDDVPPHKRQLGIEGEGDFKKADKPPKASEEKWFADLPDEVRQHIQQTDQYANSIYQNYQALQGRVAPMQRLVEDLRKEVGDLRGQLQGESEATPSPSLEDLDSNAAWKEVADEFPDESAELRKFFSGKQAELDQANQQVQQLQDQLDQVSKERKQTEWNRLKARHPDADVVRSHPAFHQFLQRVQADPQANPELVRKVASPFFEDVADVIDAFKTEYFSAQQPAPHQPGNGQSMHSEVPAQSVTPPNTQTRPRPPSPSPESQGAGMSVARGRPQVVSEREAFRQEMRRRRKQNVR